MSFGVYKSGTNVTDKKTIKKLHKQNWPVDRISSHLGVKPEHVTAVIGDSSPPEAEEPSLAEQIKDLFINGGFDAEEIAEKLGVDTETVDEVIAEIDGQ